ncbi:MAG: fumarylacetoacetate hydrolase family protein [Burkholderiaceae bacterium]|jgi:5-oxopent-3-ene-1,2,5-tricarboxylate decarboxylase/2-hydroxyhepta-2,4-diene-1,7-dioate isomerase
MIEVLARARGQEHLESIHVDATLRPAVTLDWEVPIWGTVVGVLLNDEESFLAHAEEFDQAPYLAPPRAPVLYLKPANTWRAHGQSVILSEELDCVHTGAALGVVIGRQSTRVKLADALACISGYVVANDLSEVHTSFYRPAIRERCRDGFCPIGPWVMPAAAVRSGDALVLRTYVNGQLRGETTTARMVRSIARLIVDITEFMSLSAGDVLLLSPGVDRPRAVPGDVVRIEVPGVGILENRLARASSDSRVAA